MAANTEIASSGRTNYYKISYGMLSSNTKEVPEGYTEISESELKSKTQEVENIDLRSKYVDKKQGDYPFKVFYPSIEGVIKTVEKEKYDKGVSLNVTILDKDGDTTVLQTKFYNKVASDFLNRLASIKDTGAELSFRPYSIPSSAEIEGRKVKFYNSGVSIREDGKKVDRAFDSEKGLPGTERIKDAQGEDVTSRVKQVDFLFDKIAGKFSTPEGEVQQKVEEPMKKDPRTSSNQEDTGLPF